MIFIILTFILFILIIIFIVWFITRRRIIPLIPLNLPINPPINPPLIPINPPFIDLYEQLIFENNRMIVDVGQLIDNGVIALQFPECRQVVNNNQSIPLWEFSRRYSLPENLTNYH